ncbi:DUF4279 domain-containing protein [Spirulina sp. 06S082]|uniref:DUF4279 domain-containing protein n=1 Tax=Spirulina sp. 06S082 TaxID=3110248 RepID=UPI002B20BFDC|nr:DUF4279 domain-containing protein [Spirulina sp. 06S082]MEA5470216.1 DUF4279 domain-containing protein [Spirulina sp. 06S082]
MYNQIRVYEVQTMKNEFFCAFTVLNFDCDPDEITAFVGVTPSKVWKKGDLIYPNASVSHKQNGWTIKSELDNSIELSKHIEVVLNKIEDNWQSFVKICCKYYAELECTIYIYDEDNRPTISFDKKLVKKLAQLNAEIDVDLYILSED